MDEMDEDTGRVLWLAVLHQALKDACLRPGVKASPERRAEADEARAWFHAADEDFRLVCLLARVDPEEILAEFRQRSRRAQCAE